MHLSSMLLLRFLRRRQVKASAFKLWSFLNIFVISFVFLSKKYFNLCPPPGPGVARNCTTYMSCTLYIPWWSQPKRSLISFSVNLEGIIKNLIYQLLEVQNISITNLFRSSLLLFGVGVWSICLEKGRVRIHSTNKAIVTLLFGWHWDIKLSTNLCSLSCLVARVAQEEVWVSCPDRQASTAL